MVNDSQLTVRRETAEDALVLYVEGEVDLATSLDLGREFAGIEHEVPPLAPLVVDMNEVTFLSSAGLALLVDLNQRCADAGVDLRVVAGNPTVMRALTTTGLDTVLPMADDHPGTAGGPAR